MNYIWRTQRLELKDISVLILKAAIMYVSTKVTTII